MPQEKVVHPDQQVNQVLLDLQVPLEKQDHLEKVVLLVLQESLASLDVLVKWVKRDLRDLLDLRVKLECQELQVYQVFLAKEDFLGYRECLV